MWILANPELDPDPKHCRKRRMLLDAYTFFERRLKKDDIIRIIIT